MPAQPSPRSKAATPHALYSRARRRASSSLAMDARWTSSGPSAMRSVRAPAHSRASGVSSDTPAQESYGFPGFQDWHLAFGFGVCTVAPSACRARWCLLHKSKPVCGTRCRMPSPRDCSDMQQAIIGFL